MKSSIFSTDENIKQRQDLRYEFCMGSSTLVDIYLGKIKIAQLFSSNGMSMDTVRTLINHDKYYGECAEFDIKGETVNIDKLFIKEPYRNKGYGTQILSHMETVYKEEGYKRIVLSAYPIVDDLVSPEVLKDIQKSLHRFYKALSYKDLVDMTSELNNCNRFIFMSKVL